MAASLMSSPVRMNPSGSDSPGFKSQRKMSAGTILKKIQTLEDTIESLRQQLVFARSEEETVPTKEIKKSKQPKEAKETKQTKEKAPTMQKKTQNTTDEEKDKIPMPWTGGVDFTTCVGLKAQYGLFIQCGKTCDMTSASFQIDNHECRFCNDCSKKCDENGKHPVGTMEERIEAGVGKYVNAKTGKKETVYIEVLEKMGITKEQALESAAKRGFQIPDWMLEKTEKKRGRPAASGVATVNKVDTETETETKQKKQRQPRTKANVATNDTPHKNSAQSSVCLDLNQENGEVTPVASENIVAATFDSIPQEKDKKKRGRPVKSNAQNNVGESEMQKLIIQATTEKKKRLSMDPADISPSSQKETSQTNIETCLTFENESNENKEKVEDQDEDVIFEMFDKMLEQDEKEKQESAVISAPTVEPVVIAATVATNEKKEKTKKAKNSEEKVEKVKNKDDKAVAKKEAAAAAKKKAEEEAAAAAKKKAEEEAKKKAEKEEDEETEDEDEDEELECEEYEYDGETYGLAPNGDIYSQDGDLVGKLTNGIPKMFN